MSEMLGIFNLNRAREAAAAEATEKPWLFEFNDHLYELLPAKQWPLSVSAKLADGRIDEAMALLLVGENNFDRLAEDGAVMGDLELIMEAYAADAGLENSGNSPAPPPPVSTRT